MKTLKELKKILLATSSEGKLREFKQLLKDEEVEIVTIPDVFGNNIPEEPEENGNTFLDNAYIKAKYYHELSKLPCLADDSGMLVEALDGFPGLISKRFCITPENPNPSDEDHNQALIKMLHKKGLTESRAQYECGLILYVKEDEVYDGTGFCNGLYKEEPSGSHGFSFDRYFYPDDFNHGMSIADLADEDKNSISHRGRALRRLLEWKKFIYDHEGDDNEKD